VKITPMAASASEPSPVSPTDVPAFAILHRTVREVFPNVVVAPALSIGATDARYYTAISKNVYRFLPITFNDEDLGRVHGTNERVSLAGYSQCVRFYYQLINNCAMTENQ